MKRTQELIRQLASDLSRSTVTIRFPFKFWMSFTFLACVTGLSTAYIAQNWPQDAHLPAHISLVYLIEAALWGFGAIAAAWLSYDAGFPGPGRKNVYRVASVILTVAACCVVWKWSSLSMSEEALMEMDVLRGRCGIFIAGSSAVASACMFFVVRGAAPTRLSWAGLWSAASMSCVGAFFMHLVCPHDNPLHLLVWHFLPIAVLMAVGAVLGSKVLRWA